MFLQKITPFCVSLLIFKYTFPTDFFFYVLLTVHLSIILVIDQLNAQILAM